MPDAVMKLLDTTLKVFLKLIDPIMGYMLGVNRTKRKAAEEKLRRKNEMAKAGLAAPDDLSGVTGGMRDGKF